VGEWGGIGDVQEAAARKASIRAWHVQRFKVSGDVWPVRTASVLQWPAAATVCNCTGVTRGQLSDAISTGCADLPSLQQRTSASTVCGSCKPLLQEMLGSTPIFEPIKWSRTLVGTALVSIIA